MRCVATPSVLLSRCELQHTESVSAPCSMAVLCRACSASLPFACDALITDVSPSHTAFHPSTSPAPLYVCYDAMMMLLLHACT